MKQLKERPPSRQGPLVAKVVLDQQGRVLIPAEMRQAIAVKTGDTLRLDADEDGLHLRTTSQALRAAQAYLSEFVPDDVSLSDELVADRRAEAAREEQE